MTSSSSAPAASIQPGGAVAPAEREPRIDLLGLPLAELEAALAPLAVERFRARQIYQAIHQRGARDFAAMTELGKGLRGELERRFTIELPRVDTAQHSLDGTRKYLFTLADGATVETVDIPDRGRHTLCLSSQAGCALACAFCVTGYWGAGRNLTAGEIVGQVHAVRFDDPPIGPSLNLVFMGMGEPFLNLEALRRALDILLEIVSHRRVTISTAGVVPGIEAMASWSRRPNLAVSLHAPEDERRSAIMPINRTYPLADLLAALRRYPLERGRRITFEYILIRGFNDAQRDADKLVRLLRGIPAKINLIPTNPDAVLGERMAPPEPRTVEAFHRRLLDLGVTATVRRRRGDDVSAACGQLRAHGRAPRGFRRSNLSL
jgi:23S rRNA (adenine2503-C2)-methyltransferase